MAYNFKSIVDVEVVAEPTETANVLIEENGIVKKAPKSAVGGGMGGSLMVKTLVDQEAGTTSFDRTYDEIKEVLDNGGVVLLNQLPTIIALEGGFAPDMVINSSWPLYFGMLVETENDGEVIGFMPTFETEEVPYLKSDNTIGMFESTSSSGAPA